MCSLSCLFGRVFASGSIFDRYYYPGMPVGEGIGLLQRCVDELKLRMVINMPKFTLKIVDKDGIREVRPKHRTPHRRVAITAHSRARSVLFAPLQLDWTGAIAPKEKPKPFLKKAVAAAGSAAAPAASVGDMKDDSKA